MPSNPPGVDEAMVGRPVQIIARTLDPEAFKTDQDSAYVSINVRRRRVATDLAKDILAALGETHVVVERADLKRACEIAARTETAPEVARLIAASLARLIAASQNEGG